MAAIRRNGKVAVVTGGANGIGEGAVMAIARFGGDVVIADIDAVQGERVALAARALGRQALYIPTDVSDTGQIAATIAQACAQLGRLDILVNNAGGSRRVDFMKQSERSWRRHIDFNLVSMLAATQAAAPAMIEFGNGGTIVNIASTEGLRAAPGSAVYAACRAGMISFTLSMALELSAHGIRAHALAPDRIETPGLNPYFDNASDAMNAARDRYIPAGAARVHRRNRQRHRVPLRVDVVLTERPDGAGRWRRHGVRRLDPLAHRRRLESVSGLATTNNHKETAT